MLQSRDNVDLDATNFQLTFKTQNQEIANLQLTRSEFNIFSLLWSKNGVFVKNSELIEAGWNGRPVSDSSLNVAIFYLRKKLTSYPEWNIVNTPKTGYRLEYKKALDSEEKAKPTISAKYQFQRLLITTFATSMILMAFLIIEYIHANWLTLTCSKNNTFTICVVDRNLLTTSNHYTNLVIGAPTKFMSSDSRVIKE